MDGPAPDEGGKAYPLARIVFKRAPVNVSWEQLNVLNYIGLGEYLHAERFSIIIGKGRDS